MAPDIPLETLQRWMQEVCVHLGAVEDAVAAPAAARLVAPAEIGAVILPSASLTPVERLEIYQSMYVLRMHDALESDYPGLMRWLGPRRFRALVEAYVAAHPSRSYTLNRLGDHLPAYLRGLPRSA